MQCYAPSGVILIHAREQYPNIKFEKLPANAFKDWSALGTLDNEVVYHLGHTTKDKSFTQTPQLKSYAASAPAPLLIREPHGINGNLSTVMFEIEKSNINGASINVFWFSGERRRWTLAGLNSDYSDRVYFLGSEYMSVDPENVIKIKPLLITDFKQRRMVSFADISSKLPKAIVESHEKCWNNLPSNSYCVNVEGEDRTEIVDRPNPIRLYKNVLVYAICCTVENGCIKDVENQRCSYFVNDRNTGRDFYIDDDTNWTNDANKKPAVLFPSISDSDPFFTLDNSTTVAPDPPGPPGPPSPPAPPGPAGQCCGPWSSFSVFGKATKLIAYFFEINYISHVATL